MAGINLYKNSPTEGLQDGGLVTDSNPVIFPPIAAGQVSPGQKLAIRADAGYRADGTPVTVSATGANASKMAFSYDNNTWGAYGAQLTFANLATPVPTLSTTATGGSLTAGAKSYRVTAINSNGETVPCKAVTITVPEGTSTNTVTLSWSAVTGATGYKIYGRTAGSELLLATVTALTWADDGSLTPSGALPTATTVQVADGNRVMYAKTMYGTGDGATDDKSVAININYSDVVAL